MLLSIKQVITPNRKEEIILGNLSYSAYKLWNIANYEKRNYGELGFIKYPNWYEQKKRLKTNFWFKNLPSQTAQEVLNVLEQSWKSFFKLKETGGIESPKPPRFKYQGIGFKYLNNGFVKMDDGVIRLSIPKQLKLYLKESYSSQCSPGSTLVSIEYAKKNNRKHRGLYRDGTIIYNADCVGAYNISRLYKQKTKMDISNPSKCLSNPIKVSV